MLLSAVPLTFMGVEVYGCIFAVDGFNLFKLSHNLVCIIPQTKTLAPVSFKIFKTQLLMNKYFLKSCLFRKLNLGIFCDKFIFQMFKLVCFIFAPTFIIICTIHTFILNNFHGFQLAGDLGKMTNFTTTQAFWIYCFKFFSMIWFER